MVKRATGLAQAAKSSSAKRFRRSAICREFEEREVLKASTQVYLMAPPEPPGNITTPDSPFFFVSWLLLENPDALAMVPQWPPNCFHAKSKSASVA